MRWAFNPIALARLAVGGGVGQASRPWPDSWAAVQDLFLTAYNTDARDVFYGNAELPALLDLLDLIADSVSNAETLGKLFTLSAVQALEKRLANPEWLARLLPFIVSVADMEFAPGTGVALNDNPVIGSYEKIGALQVGDVSWLDPEQGSTADCYLISAMISIAWARPLSWRAALIDATRGSRDPDMLSVDFHQRIGELSDPAPIPVPPRVPLDVNRNWIYAHSASRDETWPALLERAFVMHRRRCDGEPTVKDYKDIGTDLLPHEAAQILMGGNPGRQSDGDTPFQAVGRRCRDALTRTPMMAWTKSKQEPGAAELAWHESTLVPSHAYAVLGLLADNRGNFVVLRNPFGNNDRIADSPTGAWDAGASRNGGEAVSLDQHGVFALDEARFNAFFHAVDWLELPPDPPA